MNVNQKLNDSFLLALYETKITPQIDVFIEKNGKGDSSKDDNIENNSECSNFECDKDNNKKLTIETSNLLKIIKDVNDKDKLSNITKLLKDDAWKKFCTENNEAFNINTILDIAALYLQTKESSQEETENKLKKQHSVRKFSLNFKDVKKPTNNEDLTILSDRNGGNPTIQSDRGNYNRKSTIYNLSAILNPKKSPRLEQDTVSITSSNGSEISVVPCSKESPLQTLFIDISRCIINCQFSTPQDVLKLITKFNDNIDTPPINEFIEQELKNISFGEKIPKKQTEEMRKYVLLKVYYALKKTLNELKTDGNTSDDDKRLMIRILKIIIDLFKTDDKKSLDRAIKYGEIYDFICKDDEALESFMLFLNDGKREQATSEGLIALNNYHKNKTDDLKQKFLIFVNTENYFNVGRTNLTDLKNDFDANFPKFRTAVILDLANNYLNGSRSFDQSFHYLKLLSLKKLPIPITLQGLKLTEELLEKLELSDILKELQEIKKSEKQKKELKEVEELNKNEIKEVQQLNEKEPKEVQQLNENEIKN